MPASRIEFQIRRLGPHDAQVWRELRLECLTRHPESFGSSYEEESVLAPEIWAERLKGPSAVFGGFLGPTLMGAAAFTPETRMKQRHMAWLGAMYVRESARGSGLSDALVSTVIAHARGQVAQLFLYVGATNLAAKWLYARHGFQLCGRLPRGLKVGDLYYDEEIMLLTLDSVTPKAP